MKQRELSYRPIQSFRLRRERSQGKHIIMQEGCELGYLDLDLDLYTAGTILAMFAMELGKRNANKTCT